MKSTLVQLLISILLTAIAGSALGAYCPWGDLNGDCIVDLGDLKTFAEQWLDGPGDSADFVGNNGVGMEDLSVLGRKWQTVGAPFEISEFLASNDTYLDGDGESSDWIELYNPSNQTVDLTGWYLTDEASEPDKWRFPNGLTIGSGQYLLVFASGKNEIDNPGNYPYQDGAGYYHTNFSLNKNGSDSDRYLALVFTDGESVVQQFAPYPDQFTDISFGNYPTSLQLVATGANVSYLVPSASDSSDENSWIQESFDDSLWSPATTALGFAFASSGPHAILTEDAIKKVLVPTDGNLGTSWTGGNEPFSDGGWTDYIDIPGKTGGVGYDTNPTYDDFISYDVENWMGGYKTSCYIRIPFTASCSLHKRRRGRI